MFKNMKLSTRIIGLVCLLLIMLTLTGLFALRQIHHIGHEIDNIAEDDLPLMRVVSRLTKYQLEQATRFAVILQLTYLKKQDKLEVESRNFKDAGKRITDVLREGRKLAKTGQTKADTPEMAKAFEAIDLMLGSVEKKHGEYEHHSEALLQKMASLDGTSSQKDKDELVAAALRMEEATSQLEDSLERISEQIDAMAKNLTRDAHDTQKQSFQILVPLTVLSIVGGILLSIIIVRAIVGTLRRTMGDLTTGSSEIAAASHEIANASQMLADQASSQAAALEQTSASLTQIAGYARENRAIIEGSHSLIAQAHDTIQSTKQLLSRAQQTTQNLQTGLGERLPGKLESLREALLQLNMLATQASVEASRNQATQGYAILTTEMKTFAGKSLETIHELLQQSQEATKELAQDQQVRTAANRQFADITTTSTRLKQNLDQLNEKAGEYALTISELDQALGSLSDSVQVYAATSEESAAASEQLNAQAAQMADTVGEIAVLLGGARKQKA